MIQQIGYYCVLVPTWCDFEKSFIFASMSYKMGLETQTGSPIFKIQIVGNIITLPNEFWDEERDWLLRNKQPVNIVEIVLEMLRTWGIKAEVESSTPIKRLSEIDVEARKRRILMNIKRPEQSHESYQRARELYSHKLADWNKLIEDARDDLSCLVDAKT